MSYSQCDDDRSTKLLGFGSTISLDRLMLATKCMEHRPATGCCDLPRTCVDKTDFSDQTAVLNPEAVVDY